MRRTRRPHTLKVKGTEWVEQVVAKETQPKSVPWRLAGLEAKRQGPILGGERRGRRDVTALAAFEVMRFCGDVSQGNGTL